MATKLYVLTKILLKTGRASDLIIIFDKDWEVCGIDQFYENNKTLYTDDKEKFYSKLLDHYFFDHELL
ncbi:MAG: hypothetical protein MUW56_22435 [Chryseobacterium sp.]|uniref:hypothetical protein n=1 Tax=Chryseobacterium sp. TaxID=1871047 RepID=UPI0025B851DE|nr:hypothetical protein [Chryseobacterium sp.]MCJ7936313.1 hypothetical protein [Chryseobacterium sp.]